LPFAAPSAFAHWGLCRFHSIAFAHAHWIGVASAVITLAFELTFVACVLVPRTTPAYLATGAGLHAGIWLLMRAPFFQLLALYAAFAAPIREWRRRWAPALLRRDPAGMWTVIYDGYCPLCIRTMTQLDVLDGATHLRYVDLEREWARATELAPNLSRDEMREEMTVVTPERRVLREFFAFREIGKRVRPGRGESRATAVRRERVRGARVASEETGKRKRDGD